MSFYVCLQSCSIICIVFVWLSLVEHVLPLSCSLGYMPLSSIFPIPSPSHLSNFFLSLSISTSTSTSIFLCLSITFLLSLFYHFHLNLSSLSPLSLYPLINEDQLCSNNDATVGHKLDNLMKMWEEEEVEEEKQATNPNTNLWNDITYFWTECISLTWFGDWILCF